MIIMTEPKLNFKTTKSQKEFIELNSRWKAFIGGIRSGKTHAGAFQAFIYSNQEHRKGCNGLIAGATYKMLQDAIIPKIQEVFPDYLIKDYNKSEKKMKLINGTTLFFRPFESKRQIDRIRGTEFNFIWIDEAAYLPEYAFEVVQGRLTQGEDTKGYITTSPRGFNWVYEYFVNPDRTNDYQAIHGISSSENPTLPQEWIDDIKQSYSDEYLKQEFHGQFIKFEGLIYKDFSESKHVISDIDNFDIQRYFYGYDAGTTNPRVFLKIAKTPNDEHIIIDEMYRKNWLLTHAIEDFKEQMYEGGTVYCDPSAKNDIMQMQERSIDAEGADNSVEPGIQHVKSSFDDNRLYILETCKETINELHSYRWKEDTDGNLKDKPVKELDHAMDAMRYALFTDSKGGIFFGSLEW